MIRTIEETITRKTWRGETTETTQYAEITGTVTEVTNVGPSEQQYRPRFLVDAGSESVGVRYHWGLARTADGTERGMPEAGERVTILAGATPGKSGDYLAQSITVH